MYYKERPDDNTCKSISVYYGYIWMWVYVHV